MQPESAQKLLTEYHEARREFEEYIAQTNEVVGVASFAIAISCVGLQRPQLYALLGLFFVFLVWSNKFLVKAKRLRVTAARKRIRFLGYDPGSAVRLLWSTKIALIGWAFLCLVAVGLSPP